MTATLNDQQKACIRALQEHLDESNGLLVAMMHEKRSVAEIEEQVALNRIAIESAKDFLGNPSQHAAAPQDCVVVPLNPDDAMQMAGAQAVRMDTTVLNRIWTANAVFKAMIAAAPLPRASGACVGICNNDCAAEKAGYTCASDAPAGWDAIIAPPNDSQPSFEDAPATAAHAGASDPLSDFQEGQWWVRELDEWAKTGSDDQKRAVAVVHHMLRSAAAAPTPTATAPAALTDYRIKRMAADFWKVQNVMGVDSCMFDAVGFAHALLATNPDSTGVSK